MHVEETVFLACLVIRSGLGWLIAHLLVIKNSLGWKVMQLEVMHLCKFYKFISWLLHFILIQCGNASYILSNHQGPDTGVVMKNRLMVQKLTSVINGFLLFRPLVNGLGMSTRLKNKPELCLNRTKSWSTGRSYFVVGVVLSTVCPAFTLVAIQTLQLCTCSLEIKLKINLKFKLKEVQSFSCACFINCLLFSCVGFVDPWTQKHAVMHGMHGDMSPGWCLWSRALQEREGLSLQTSGSSWPCQHFTHLCRLLSESRVLFCSLITPGGQVVALAPGQKEMRE